MNRRGVQYFHAWGTLWVRKDEFEVHVTGHPGSLTLKMPDTSDNLSDIMKLFDRIFEAGRKAELRHIRETLGIKD